MSKLIVFNHPLIHHKLSLIRNIATSTKDFRQTVSEIAMLMAYEITRDLPTKEVVVETPIAFAKTKVLAQNIVIVPVLRAGLGMIDGILSLIPNAKIGHIGVYRDEETLSPNLYYVKLPAELETASVLVVDPMLATGGSASYAIDILKKKGAKNISFVGIVAAPEGVNALVQKHPDVNIFLAIIDEKLNEKGYIVPGLGDCGDRLFGTK